LPPKLSTQYIWDSDQLFLGKGAYAVVLAARQTGGSFGLAPRGTGAQRRAIKVVEKGPLSIRHMLPQLSNEVKLHTELRHPNVLRVLDQDETHTHMYLVLELASRSLLAWAEHWPNAQVPERSAIPKYLQIVAAVRYCHERGVVHRDLTTGNVLLVPTGAEGEEVCKLGDFGWACHVSSIPQAPCGSVESWAPEIMCLATGFPRPIGIEVDYWAMGIMLYVLLAGVVPFPCTQGAMDPRFISTLCSGYYVPAPAVSERMNAIIKRLLCVDPAQRLTPPDLAKALEESGPRPSPRATPSTSAGSSAGSSPTSASCVQRAVAPDGGRLRRTTVGG
jgi:serine/threonine protein kinase